MLIAVLADIHCNAPALEAVLAGADRAGAQEYWVAGDVFGRLPWAAKTWEILRPAEDRAVLGNHDMWVLSPGSAPPGELGDMARDNHRDLAATRPDALAWLDGLPMVSRFAAGRWRVTMAHGTPDYPVSGYYYPDDEAAYSWLPGPGEIVILGATHRPVLRGTAETGLLLNPGSAGEPRDGNPDPAWALLDLDAGTAELRRTTLG